MHPFAIFALILAAIWIISGLATWANKQKEAERRALLRQHLARSAPAAAQAAQRTRAAQQRAPQRPMQISQGIVQRFPDVLLPPVPQLRRAPQPRVQQPRSPRPMAKTFPRQPPPVRPGMKASPVVSAPAAPPLVKPAPEVLPVAHDRASESVTPRINAAMLSRWMTPETLNQQFLLTEILQPPLGLRDRVAGM
jgi:hypothetical protein